MDLPSCKARRKHSSYFENNFSAYNCWISDKDLTKQTLCIVFKVDWNPLCIASFATVTWEDFENCQNRTSFSTYNCWISDKDLTKLCIVFGADWNPLCLASVAWEDFECFLNQFWTCLNTVWGKTKLWELTIEVSDSFNVVHSKYVPTRKAR